MGASALSESGRQTVTAGQAGAFNTAALASMNGNGSRTSKLSPKKSMGPIDGRFSVLINEIGVPSPSIKKTIPAFELLKEGEMPSPKDNRWTQERLEQLLKKPSYKLIRDKMQMLPPHLRNNSPMTM